MDDRVMRWDKTLMVLTAMAVGASGGLTPSIRQGADNAQKLESYLATGQGLITSNDACGERPVFGQHIALPVVSFVIADHLKNDQPQKPLVLAFCGPTGTGKSLVADRCASAIHNPRVDAGATIEQQYKKGNYHPYQLFGTPTTLLISAVDFHEKTNTKWHELLDTKIRHHVYKYPQALIILDEVQFLPYDTLEYLIELLDFKQPVIDDTYGSIDFRRAIFIFTTNTGATNISATYGKLQAEGRSRLDMEYSDFTDGLEEDLKQAEPVLVAKNRVDYFIPFLPMGHEELRTAIEWTLERLRCTGQQHGTYADLQWDEGTVTWLADTSRAHAYDLAEAGLSRVSQHINTAIMVKIDRALRKEKKPAHTLVVHVSSNGVNKPTITIKTRRVTPKKTDL